MPPLLSNVKSSWWWKSVSSQYLTEMKKAAVIACYTRSYRNPESGSGEVTQQCRGDIPEAYITLLLGATIMMLIMIIVMIVIILQTLVLFCWWGRHWWWWWWWWWYYSVTLLVGESNFNVLHLENLLEWHCFLCTAHTTLFSFYHIVYNVMLCWLLLC